MLQMKDEKLNILFICNKSPWPPSEGGPIAMNNLIEGLIDAGHHLKVLALNTNKYATDPKDIPHDYRKKTAIEFVFVDLSIKVVDAFANLFTNKSYHVQRFISNAVSSKLIEILSADSYDLVQIETLFMAPYVPIIRKHSRAKIFLRAHNIEHVIWQRLAESTKNPFKKYYLKHLSRTLASYEKHILDDFDGIIPITQKDADFFGKLTQTPVLPVSFGVKMDTLETVAAADVEHALFHIGSMNWIPNEEGIKWFLHEVWPDVHRKLPQLKLYLAGREMPDWLSHLSLPNVIVLGEVDNAHQFILSKSISIAPLLSGSGIRIKIIESMALGKAVVATSVGAEGINYTDGTNLLLADTPAEFVGAIEKLYLQPEYCQSVGRQARQLIEDQHQTTKIIAKLYQFYREIL